MYFFFSVPETECKVAECYNSLINKNTRNYRNGWEYVTCGMGAEKLNICFERGEVNIIINQSSMLLLE